MPEQKTFWICSFCKRKKAARRGLIEKHESHCFKNDDRVPFVGELTFIARTGEIVNYGHKEEIDGVWLEWQEHEEMPPWWPGAPGMIYDGTAWRPVPGYRLEPPEPGHGCAGGACEREIWPELDGIPLPQLRTLERLEILTQ